MQTPSEAKTKIIPIKNPRMLIKVRPLLNGRIRLTCHTAKKLIWLSDITDQEALALQAAINDAMIEADKAHDQHA